MGTFWGLSPPPALAPSGGCPQWNLCLMSRWNKTAQGVICAPLPSLGSSWLLDLWPCINTLQLILSYYCSVITCPMSTFLQTVPPAVRGCCF